MPPPPSACHCKRHTPAQQTHAVTRELVCSTLTLRLPQSRPSPLRDDHARFYAASVICGLEYMQDRNLMWRCAPKARSMVQGGEPVTRGRLSGGSHAASPHVSQLLAKCRGSWLLHVE